MKGMRSFKETLVQGHRLYRFRSFSQHRLVSSFSNSTESVNDPENENQVLVEGRGCSRTAVLNRPSVLNALSTAIGRAFCAGGDIVTLYQLINRGNIEEGKNFFRTLYPFIYIVGTYLKPHIALLNGITMGGGAGVSIPGAFRVANDKTVFATPETLIGFHPDAGASFYLSHLPGHLGEYLALTGEKLNGTEMVACGLATHFTLSSRLSLLDEHLGKLLTDDSSVIRNTLEKYGEIVSPDQSSVIHKIDLIDNCFGKDSVEEIIDTFETMTAGMTDPWCSSALKKLREASPLSLKVSLRSIREGRFQTLDQCLIREYRMSLQGIAGHISGDFCEGVRAKMVDKDFTPKWNPPCFERVTEDMVDEYFSPLNISEPELEIPTKVQGAFT